MNGYNAFGMESSAWRDGFEAGKRTGIIYKEHEMSPEEGILHIRKIVDKHKEIYEESGIVYQMRADDSPWAGAIEDIERILKEVKTRF